MKDFDLVYSEHVGSAFEVYDTFTRELVGHLTFTITNDKPDQFCFTPVGKLKGKAAATIIGALRGFFDTEVSVHFSPVIG